MDRRKFLGGLAGNLLATPLTVALAQTPKAKTAPDKGGRAKAIGVARRRCGTQHRSLSVARSRRQEHHRFLGHHLRSGRQADVPVRRRAWPVAGDRHPHSRRRDVAVVEPVSAHAAQRDERRQRGQRLRPLGVHEPAVRAPQLQHVARGRAPVLPLHHLRPGRQPRRSEPAVRRPGLLVRLRHAELELQRVHQRPDAVGVLRRGGARPRFGQDPHRGTQPPDRPRQRLALRSGGQHVHDRSGVSSGRRLRARHRLLSAGRQFLRVPVGRSRLAHRAQPHERDVHAGHGRGGHRHAARRPAAAAASRTTRSTGSSAATSPTARSTRSIPATSAWSATSMQVEAGSVGMPNQAFHCLDYDVGAGCFVFLNEASNPSTWVYRHGGKSTGTGDCGRRRSRCRPRLRRRQRRGVRRRERRGPGGLRRRVRAAEVLRREESGVPRLARLLSRRRGRHRQTHRRRGLSRRGDRRVRSRHRGHAHAHPGGVHRDDQQGRQRRGHLRRAQALVVCALALPVGAATRRAYAGDAEGARAGCRTSGPRACSACRRTRARSRGTAR